MLNILVWKKNVVKVKIFPNLVEAERIFFSSLLVFTGAQTDTTAINASLLVSE